MSDKSHLWFNKNIVLSALFGAAIGFSISVGAYSLWTYIKGINSHRHPGNEEAISPNVAKDLLNLKAELNELRQMIAVFSLQPATEHLSSEPFLSDEDDEFLDVDSSTDLITLPQEIIDELDELANMALGESPPSSQKSHMYLNSDDLGFGSQAYARCLVYRKAYSRTPEFLWRFARASYLASTEVGTDENAEAPWNDADLPNDAASLTSSSSTLFPRTLNDLAYEWTSRRQFVQHGVTIARRALSGAKRLQNRTSTDTTVDPQTMAEIYKWLAVLVGCASEFVGMTQRIKYGAEFKELIDKAIEFNPNDAYSHHLRGRWCYEVYNLTWLERKVASRLFATPPTATLEEAMLDLEEVEQIRPEFYAVNLLYLAKCCISNSDYPAAAIWLKKAKGLIDRNRKSLPKLDSVDVLNEIQTLFPKYSSYLVES